MQSRLTTDYDDDDDDDSGGGGGNNPRCENGTIMIMKELNNF